MKTVLERLIGHSPNGELEPFDLFQVQCAIANLVQKKMDRRRNRVVSEVAGARQSFGG